MKVRILYFLVLVIFFVNCFPLINTSNKKLSSGSYNNYYRLSAIADSLHFIKQYQKSFETMDTVFSKLKPLNIEEFAEYNTYLKNKHILEKDIHINEVESLVRNYGVSLEVFKSDSILKLIYNKKNIKEARFLELYTEYEKSLNLDLRKKLIEALVEDQETFRKGSEEDLRKVYLKNEKMIIELFENNIYPNSSVIGPRFYLDNLINFEALLSHTSESVRKNYFLPKIKKFIKEGKCYNVNTYMMLIDQMTIGKDNEEQKYGTFSIHQLNKKKYAEYNRNRRKLDIGTTSIQYDVWYQKR